MNTNTSPKKCTACGKQAGCRDTRHHGNHIRRRYLCECGARWTTYESRRERLDNLLAEKKALRSELEGAREFERKLKAAFKNLFGVIQG